jgi:hypothetical protein
MAETQRAPRGRVKRQPVSQRSRLAVNGKDPNYVYRFVNDIGDRINMFQEAGYELVSKADHKIGDNRVDIASPDGSHASVSVGISPKGESQRAYLMRQKREWYEEDQRTKQEEIKQTQRQLKNPDLEGSYGKIETEDRRAGKLPDDE